VSVSSLSTAITGLLAHMTNSQSACGGSTRPFLSVERSKIARTMATNLLAATQQQTQFLKVYFSLQQLFQARQTSVASPKGSLRSCAEAHKRM
jgi:hypothetical protein